MKGKWGRLFDNKYFICNLLLIWLFIVIVLFFWLGTKSIPFFTFGPSKHTQIIGLKIDTWGKWTGVVLLTATNTIFTEYVFDFLQPWIMTTVIDPKTINLPLPKQDMLYISVVCSVYRTIIQVVMMYIMLSQVDFLIVRVAADTLVTVVTTQHILQEKTFDPTGHFAYEMQKNDASVCSDSGVSQQSTPLNIVQTCPLLKDETEK
jgi:hypothetical protein